MFILLSIILCIGCKGKKENGSVEIYEDLNYNTINEKDFSFWDGLVDMNDFTIGPNGTPCKVDVIQTDKAAAIVGEALKRSAFQEKHYMKDFPQIVIEKSKYWVVQGTTVNNQDNAMFVYFVVIQRSNGKVLDFRIERSTGRITEGITGPGT